MPARTLRGRLPGVARRRYDLVIGDGRLKDGTGIMLADDARCDVLLQPISPEEVPESVEKARRGRS
jgi:hypothetical protein